MDTDLVTAERQDGAALLRFNRPDKLNALSSAMLRQFRDQLEAVERDESIRVVVLTGSGKAFVAGADITEYAGQSFTEFVEYQLYSRELFTYLDHLPKTAVAAVNGYALGGGFEIALCCDILIASTRARFGLPEGQLGLSPGGGGTQKLTRAVGRYVAADILLSARQLTAEEAKSMGLVAEVTEPDQLLEVAVAKARDISRVGPLALREMKRLIRQGPEASLETALSLEQEVLFRLYQTADAAEGIRAFKEKRSPSFQGR